jgi:hypothetical protein
MANHHPAEPLSPSALRGLNLYLYAKHPIHKTTLIHPQAANLPHPHPLQHASTFTQIYIFFQHFRLNRLGSD